MRRVLAISLAILVVTIAARGVVAQDSQQDGNDLLLKILKERNVLTDSEYQEIKGQLAQEQSAVDQKLTALDRSLADYLAKAGDVSAGNTTYVQNQGVTFGSGDGNWSIYFGGLFQFSYMYTSGENIAPNGGFGLDENRLDFGGTIFDPNMTFYIQAQGTGTFTLLDAWVNYNICDFAQLRVGRMKTPSGRQFMTDQSDRAFGRLNGLFTSFAGQTWNGFGGNFAGNTSAGAVAGRMAPGRDTGIMFHNVADLDDNADGMKLEWALGLWNGLGTNRAFGGVQAGPGSANAETWLMWGFRLGFYPMGYIPYVEGDWDVSQDPKFGIAGSYFSDTTHNPSAITDKNPNASYWEIDAVLCWMGLYFTAEYHNVTVDKYGMQLAQGNTTAKSASDTGWFVQAGYFVMPQELEVLLKYSMWKGDNKNEINEIALGLAYYLNGHEWKVIAEIGQIETKRVANTTVVPNIDSSKTKDKFIRLVLQADW